MAERDSKDHQALAVIAGDGPPIDDPDPESRIEREVNRLWAALVWAGRQDLCEAEEDVRRLVDQSPWPEVRGQALIALCLWAPDEGRERARTRAGDPSADQLERVAALDALREFGVVEPKDVELVERLASDPLPPVALAARRVLEHD